MPRVLFAALFLWWGLPATARAQTTFTVTNTADRGPGSLRNAIGAANAAATDDTINFAIPANDGGWANGFCTITLTSGELGIANNGNLTINSPGTGIGLIEIYNLR